MAALHILIADPDTNATVMAAHILIKNGHNVETCQDGIQALKVIQQRHNTNKIYDLLICATSLPGMSALRLIAELRMSGIKPGLAMISQLGELTPTIRTEALKLGCKTFFEHPLPLTELNDFVNNLAAHTVTDDSGPYFGTSKISRKGAKDISGAHRTLTPTRNTIPSDGTTSYHRQSSGTFNLGSPTGRIRRSSTGTRTHDKPPVPSADTRNQTAHTPRPEALPPLEDPFHIASQNASADHNTNHSQQPPSTTQRRSTHSVHSTKRIRRSTTGSFSNTDIADISTPPAPSHPPYQVACAHCQQPFFVEARPQEYVAVCSHCAGPNRILPLPSA